MKSSLPLTVTLILISMLATVSLAPAAPLGRYQHGTVIRMRMGDCVLMQWGVYDRFRPAAGCPI